MGMDYFDRKEKSKKIRLEVRREVSARIRDGWTLAERVHEGVTFVCLQAERQPTFPVDAKGKQRAPQASLEPAARLIPSSSKEYLALKSMLRF
jgi:hypothetical protein